METNQSNRALSLNNTSSGGISNNDDADSTLFSLLLRSEDNPSSDVLNSTQESAISGSETTNTTQVSPNMSTLRTGYVDLVAALKELSYTGPAGAFEKYIERIDTQDEKWLIDLYGDLNRGLKMQYNTLASWHNRVAGYYEAKGNYFSIKNAEDLRKAKDFRIKANNFKALSINSISTTPTSSSPITNNQITSQNNEATAIANSNTELQSTMNDIQNASTPISRETINEINNTQAKPEIKITSIDDIPAYDSSTGIDLNKIDDSTLLSLMKEHKVTLNPADSTVKQESVKNIDNLVWGNAKEKHFSDNLEIYKKFKLQDISDKLTKSDIPVSEIPDSIRSWLLSWLLLNVNYSVKVTDDGMLQHFDPSIKRDYKKYDQIHKNNLEYYYKLYPTTKAKASVAHPYTLEELLPILAKEREVDNPQVKPKAKITSIDDIPTYDSSVGINLNEIEESTLLMLITKREVIINPLNGLTKQESVKNKKNLSPNAWNKHFSDNIKAYEKFRLAANQYIPSDKKSQIIIKNNQAALKAIGMEIPLYNLDEVFTPFTKEEEESLNRKVEELKQDGWRVSKGNFTFGGGTPPGYIASYHATKQGTSIYLGQRGRKHHKLNESNPAQVEATLARYKELGYEVQELEGQTTTINYSKINVPYIMQNASFESDDYRRSLYVSPSGNALTLPIGSTKGGIIPLNTNVTEADPNQHITKWILNSWPNFEAALKTINPDYVALTDEFTYHPYKPGIVITNPLIKLNPNTPPQYIIENYQEYNTELPYNKIVESRLDKKTSEKLHDIQAISGTMPLKVGQKFNINGIVYFYGVDELGTFTEDENGYRFYKNPKYSGNGFGVDFVNFDLFITEDKLPTARAPGNEPENMFDEIKGMIQSLGYQGDVSNLPNNWAYLTRLRDNLIAAKQQA